MCITLCSRSKEDRVPWIEKKAGFSFERIGPPQPKEMATVAAARAVDAVAAVSDEVMPWFASAAAELLQREPDAQKALAKALAKLTGARRLHAAVSCCAAMICACAVLWRFRHSLRECMWVCAGQANIKRRSLLSGHEGFTTFSFQAEWTMERPGYVFGFLRRRFDEATVNQVGRMRLTSDQKGAVFDLPSELVDDFVAKCAATRCALPAIWLSACWRMSFSYAPFVWSAVM